MPSESKNSAGKTVSVRMPPGTIEELKAATGVKFSTLVRWTMLALLERKRAELRGAAPAGLEAIVAEGQQLDKDQ